MGNPLAVQAPGGGGARAESGRGGPEVVGGVQTHLSRASREPKNKLVAPYRMGVTKQQPDVHGTKAVETRYTGGLVWNRPD